MIINCEQLQIQIKTTENLVIMLRNMFTSSVSKVCFLIFMTQIMPSIEHARLMEPPSRASMWRLGFPTPVDQVIFIESLQLINNT